MGLMEIKCPICFFNIFPRISEKLQPILICIGDTEIHMHFTDGCRKKSNSIFKTTLSAFQKVAQLRRNLR